MAPPPFARDRVVLLPRVSRTLVLSERVADDVGPQLVVDLRSELLMRACLFCVNLRDGGRKSAADLYTRAKGSNREDNSQYTGS